MEYLKHLPPFGQVQGLSEDKILELVEFTLPHKWKNQLIVQGPDLAGKSLNELVEFCKHLKTDKEIFYGRGYGSNPPKNPISPVPVTTNHRRYQREKPDRKTLERGCKNSKTKDNFKPTFPLHSPGNDMNLCKVIQVQAKYTKENWSSARG